VTLKSQKGFSSVRYIAVGGGIHCIAVSVPRKSCLGWVRRRFSHLGSNCEGGSGRLQVAVAVEERERLVQTQVSTFIIPWQHQSQRFRLMFSRPLQHQLHRRTTITTPAQRQQLYTVESCLNAQTSSSRASPNSPTMSVRKGLSSLLSGRQQPSSLRASKLPSPTLLVAFTSATMHLSHRIFIVLMSCVSLGSKQ
jgi:hypothetical protein